MNPRARPVQVSLAVFLLGAVLLGLAAWRYLGASALVSLLLAINLATFPLWAWDKLQARRGGWRVPEATLHVVAAMGASGASLISMRLFRHKTSKRRFTILYSVLLVLQIFGLLWYLRPPSAE